MRKLLPALLAITLTANAAETVKTPYGTLSFILDDSPVGDTDKIALDGKPVGSFTNYGYPQFAEKHYQLGAKDIWWCPKMYADKRRANKKQRRHGIFEVWKLKIPFAVPVAVGRI